MQNLHSILYRLSVSSAIARSLKETTSRDPRIASNALESVWHSRSRAFSTKSSGPSDDAWEKGWDNVGSSRKKPEPDGTFDLDWNSDSSWSTGLTKDHFDGQAVGRQVAPGAADVLPLSPSMSSPVPVDEVSELEKENRRSKAFVDGWGERMREMSVSLKQVREPGARGSYLKDSEKAEMYRLHKENPQLYTVPKLANDYRIMRQRVHAILWLKELEEEEEKKLGRPLDDSVELLLDTCPE
ncbi:hypothetical protein HHK36_002335 [Tetracentron sinense]|uniref:Uncharacterized protein n=1 Tax=Tetracentron sinense TaxID=13715 RepID=A0A835DVK2_TETSI|nr:hypothetical protein HHK36_002335 [Tetracentron sinense]